MTTYIIEHLEPELFEWCVIEYRHISKIVGKENLWITNIKENDKSKLNGYGKIISSSVKSLNLNNVCILDPEAPKTLFPEDKSKFDFFVFGGILGDNPPRKRTGPELTQFFPKAETRNIGDKQMSTDNAVYVVKTIIEGTPLKKISFKDGIEIPIKKGESTILPYRYALVNGKLLISHELLKLLTSPD